MKTIFSIQISVPGILLLFFAGVASGQPLFVRADSAAPSILSYTFSGGSFQSYGCSGFDPTYWMNGNGHSMTINFVTPQTNPSIRVWGMNSDDTGEFIVNNSPYPLNSSTASYDTKVICNTTYGSPGPTGVLFSGGCIIGSNTASNGANYSYQNVTIERSNVTSVTILRSSGSGWGIIGVTIQEAVGFDLTLLLEGPYNSSTGLMNDHLRVNSILPLEEPFSTLGFQQNPTDGGEVIDPPVFAVNGSNAVVDWVFLELGAPDDPSVILATRSALLLANGKVVDLDGASPVFFSGIPAGNYYVVARHRNHLTVMTPGTLSALSYISVSHDFTTGSAFGNLGGPNAQKMVSPGIFGLYACDLNQAGTIDASDRSIVWNNRNQTGYLSEDSNLDGVCDAVERSQAWNNRNKQSYVPE